MSTAPTAAIVRRPVVDAIQSGKANITNRLPRAMDSERFFLGIMTAVQKNPTLLKCEPNSVLMAAYDAAEQGCSLSPSLGLGWLIPYGAECQFQPSYRFFMQRAYETGDIKSFFAEVVYKGDRFERQFAPKRNLIHTPSDGDRNRENRMGAYALVEFIDGSIEWEYLSAEQIERHRNKSKQPNSMKWTDFWEEGFRITPIRVLAKRLPLKSRKLVDLIEAINKDTERELDTPIDGGIEYATDSPLTRPAVAPTPEKVTPVPGFQRAGMPAISYTVGKMFTFITGNVTKIASDLKKLHAEPYEGGRWKIPAGLTQDFLDICEKAKLPPPIEIQDVIDAKPAEPVSATDSPNPFDQPEGDDAGLFASAV